MSTQSAYAQEVERAVVELLQQLMKVSHVSAREVDRRVGLSHHRLSKVIRGESDLSVIELSLVCQALDLDPARVVRTAEAMVSPIEVLAPQQEPSHMIVRLRRGQVPVAPTQAAPQLDET